MIIARVLIVSDQQETADIWSHGIKRDGMEVDTVGLNPQAIHLVTSRRYDLVIIDIYENESAGLLFCRRIRAVFDNPLLVFTYEGDERYHVQLYREGADECVTKPTGPLLFLAKVRAWLHRASLPHSRTKDLHHQDFHLDTAGRVLTTQDGEKVKLSNLEYRLVFLLLTNRGQDMPSELLIDQVWREYENGDSSLLKRLVYRLRRKIEPDPKNPRYVESIPGYGYRFRSD